MAAAMRLIAKQGDTIDLLLFRDAGLGPAHVSRVLEANPGLSRHDPILPLGTLITVPATDNAAAARTLPLIQLWD
ncbi:phage tail protein X [Sphingobium wenxiniae]|uniref:Phage tail protein X n=1 Tax=Sphingobium wenxiniae (strain DSM 21828 / CGMCC 1.7748 / JZ-1) TaxID=595605 RepID=A0A562KCU1_SPHWJ|nr:tail protein X [Sphingobium wenxiniae]MBB6191519.1 phage tail protein X [Sphingobium wenxiniae]TWH93192.1 phage tail protein X [Sphingobium wenxiniae]